MNKHKLWILIVLIPVIILPLPSIAQNRNMEQDMDLAEYKIINEKVAKFLKAETIKVRRLSFVDRLQELLPIIKLRNPDDIVGEDRLNKILKTFGHENVKIQKKGNTLTVKQDSFVCWAHQASGGFKYTAKRNAVAETSFREFKEAVNTALEIVEKTKIIRLTEGEEMDILSVSAINNALATAEKPENPQELFISDYYVSFGRRFNGVPIVGSYLVFRLDAEKNPVMVKMNWREIIGPGEMVTPMKKEITEILSKHPDYCRAFGEKSPQDIVITQMQSGYIEAPLNFKQIELRPGSLVSFKMRPAMDEEAVQLVLPLEEQYADQSILGEMMK
ncbi:MAG: hypothetical protein JW786_15375 [Desulfobacterales bacterium]|nr:hypothetical protein [Desulfobacterales bacterium]